MLANLYRNKQSKMLIPKLKDSQLHARSILVKGGMLSYAGHIGEVVWMM